MMRESAWTKSLFTLSRILSRIPLVYQVVIEPLLMRYKTELPSIRWYGETIQLDISDVIHRKICAGTFEVFERRVLRRLLREGSVAIDVGAHCGFMALAMSSCVGESGSVVAFEPISENYRKLVENTKARRSIIRSENVAVVGGQEEFLILGRPDLWRLDENKTSGNYSSSYSANAQTVSTCNVNEALRSLARVDLMKIDVEGMEVEIICALSDESISKIGSILFEVVVERQSPTADQQRVLEFLESRGFRVEFPILPIACSSKIVGLSFDAVSALFRFFFPLLHRLAGAQTTTVNLLATRNSRRK